MHVTPIRLFFSNWRLQETLATAFCLMFFISTMLATHHLMGEIRRINEPPPLAISPGLSDAQRHYASELDSALKKAQEKGLPGTYPFDAGPDPTGNHYILHPYDYNRWKARKALAEELNDHLRPVKNLYDIAAKVDAMERGCSLEEAEAIQNKLKKSTKAKILILLFHLPLLLWLATLTIRYFFRLVAFRERLPNVRLQHGH